MKNHTPKLTHHGRVVFYNKLYMKNLITILCLSINLVLGCIDGIEVELWDECYNIEDTDSLQLSFNSGISGPIPSEIGSLTNLI